VFERRPPALLLHTLGAGGLIAFALFGASPYELRVLTVAGYHALAAIGYQFIFGAAGSLSMAQGALFGVGAYVAGTLGVSLGWSVGATLPPAAVASGTLAGLLGLATVRARSHYFALATLAAAQVGLLLVVNLPETTGGANGLSGVPGLSLFGTPVPRGLPTTALIWAVVAVGGIAATILLGGCRGRTLVAAGNDPITAAAAGIAPARARVTAMVAAGLFAGAAGALAVHTQRVVSPEVMEFPTMVALLTICVVGGRGRISGAVVGALLVVHLPEWFRFLGRGYLFVEGAALLLCVLIAPGGIVGLVERLFPGRPPRPPTPAPLPARAIARRSDALSIRGLSKSFGGVRAVDGVDLTVGSGRIVGLIGANGSGKTTLLNLTSGVERPDSGEILLLGRDVTRYSPDRRARSGLARTFQATALPDDATGVAATSVPLLARGLSPRRAEAFAMSVLAKIGASDLATARCGALPPAARRRLDIARAIAARPSVLLLDEPAAGLSESERSDIARLLRGLADGGVAILAVEHDVGFLRRLVDGLAVMEGGRLLFNGPPEAALNDPAVVAAYGRHELTGEA